MNACNQDQQERENLMSKTLSAETWHIAPQIVDDEIIILNDCGSLIATVPLWKDEDPDDDSLEQQSRQHVALIAVAPALLYAAELAEDALRDLARSDDGTCSISALHALRDAISRTRPPKD